MTAPARVLFVDDETRVLTAMRAMFRREYDVLIADSGAAALEALREHDVDVIVSDQRMPGMTGVEMLREARGIAPRAMRILLTGYADLAAIEHAINEAEVFRYLMKPCPRAELREVVELAIGASRTAELDAAVPAAGAVVESTGEASAERLSESERASSENAEDAENAEIARVACANAGGVVAEDVAEDVGLLVLSGDDSLATGVREAVGGQHPVHVAPTLEAAVALLQAQPIGVVVTDLAVDEEAVAALTVELRRQVPELVTIVASDRSDAHLMIGLINRSQVFRFLLKPVSVGQSRIWLASAVSRHRELLSRPGAVRRLQVEAPPSAVPPPASGAIDAPDADSAREAPAVGAGVLSRVLGGIRALRSRVAP